jgi:hypothetical protein
MTFFKSLTLAPITTLGRMALGFALAGFLLNMLWSIMPFGLGGFPGLLCSALGGLLALVAIIRDRERSWLVILAVLPLLFALLSIPLHFIFPD